MPNDNFTNKLYSADPNKRCREISGDNYADKLFEIDQSIKKQSHQICNFTKDCQEPLQRILLLEEGIAVLQKRRAYYTSVAISYWAAAAR